MMMKLRYSILLLFSLTSIVTCVVEDFSVEDLKQLQKSLHESSTYMAREVRDEDAVICIGATRSGKSTLINYLIGNELEAERLFRGHPVTIRKSNYLSRGPEIGGGSTSETIIPTRYISAKLPHLVIWDSPGFDDNRGSVQDITNAFYLYQLLHKVKTLKIVLVIDINDILNDNMKPFVSVLTSVEDLLGYKNETHSSILSVIFTKVPDTLNDEPVDVELISDILSRKFLSSKMSLSETSKDIVEFLINNNNRIAFFKRAKPGKVTSDIDVNIFQAINSSSQLEKDTLMKLNPSISDKSKNCLFKSRNLLLPKEAFNDLEKVIRSVIEKKVQDMKNNYNIQGAENAIKAHVAQLNLIERQLFNAITHESDFYNKMEIIQAIDVDIKKQIEKHNLLENIQLMEFVDKLLGMEESNEVSLSLQGVLLTSDSNVREAITSVQLRLGEITKQKYNELVEQERRKHLNEIHGLYKQMAEVAKKNKKASTIFKNLLGLAAPVAALLLG